MLPTPPEGLRHSRPEDAPALAAAWADPSITAWNPTPAGADPAAWIAGAEDRWSRRLALDLVIVPPRSEDLVDSTPPVARIDAISGSVAGEVGLSGFTDDPARAELGVWVAAVHRRSGLASHAVGAVTRWALTELGLDQVWARTDPANEPAEALFARLGWDRLGERSAKTIWSATPALLR
ncbi:MAG TPA: GNAT family N-acetyltransferase [Acidimicrobiales bacterium]|nr:GNAT family N-acetyltransferase [Acidimicrobiales bacterium]